MHWRAGGLDSLGNGFNRRRLSALSRLTDSNDAQPHEACGAEDEELESVPGSQGDKEVERAGAAMSQPCRQKCGGQHISGTQEHERDAPFQAAAGVMRVCQINGGSGLAHFS